MRRGTRTTRGTSIAATAALLGTFIVTGAAPASAQDFSIDLPAGQGCEFPLRFEATGGKLVTREFTDRDGNTVRILTAGKGTVNTYTNLSTGESVTINTAGSVTRTTVNPDGSRTVTSTGHNGLILFPGDVPAGPSTTHYIGRFVYTILTDGTFVLDKNSTSGQERDICAELS